MGFLISELPELLCNNEPVVKQIAASHPIACKLVSISPEAKSNFSEPTEHCQAAEKADLSGVITEITTKTSRRADKTEMWLKDLSRNELLVSVVGKSLQGRSGRAQAWTSSSG